MCTLLTSNFISPHTLKKIWTPDNISQANSEEKHSETLWLSAPP